MRFLLCMVGFLAASVSAQAAVRPDPSALCEQAIRHAEAVGHTPPGMLAAIGQVESGRPDPHSGAMRPWPWTIDADGVGQFFATKAQAVTAVAALQAQGVRSIDVGCMQVNLMHHPDAFASLDQAFDPAANTGFAVRFLDALYRRTGTWPRSIATYHSETPQIAEEYQRRVMVTWHQHVPAAAGGSGGGLVYVDSGFVYGAFGSTGRVYGLIMPER
ncbi:MAG TPA: transglycosylase SLT domain-containing protein [Acetobacteraceae bacterium]